MKILRIAMVSTLALTLSGVPAFAGDLADSVAAAATNEAAKADSQEPGAKGLSSSKAMVWSGTALFAGGMTYGLFKFINNGNGGYSEFGEASATNPKQGAAGLSVAFAGGLLMLIGKHAGGSMPSLSFAKKGVQVTKQVSW
ncbi:MAG: hypothetical protein QM736_10470 [Vicinamibacterales bacterium]